MGSIVAIKGQTLEIDLLEDVRDNGWSVSGGIAHHEGCNSGYIELLNSAYTVGVPNKFVYKVSGFESGTVNIRVGSTDGAIRTANDEYTDILTPLSGDKVMFYSDGVLDLEYLKISPVVEGLNNGRTFAFDEKSKRWVGEFSYKPEMMIRFGNKFFSGTGGGLWRHGVNELRNNFYSTQYTSKIQFYVNINPTEIKEFFSMRQKSNKVWAVTDAYIYPTEGKLAGQRTRIKKGNFKALQSDWFSAFLRNYLDPRFNTEINALMNGAPMQGSVLQITIENDDIAEVRLMSIDVEVAPHNYTY